MNRRELLKGVAIGPIVGALPPLKAKPKEDVLNWKALEDLYHVLKEAKPPKSMGMIYNGGEYFFDSEKELKDE